MWQSPLGTIKRGELVMDLVIRYHNGTRYIVPLNLIEQLNRNFDLIDLSAKKGSNELRQ